MSSAPATLLAPNPANIFQAFNAYQTSVALKAAIDLDIFTTISRSALTAREIAEKVAAPERGIRILCDYLVITGLLAKRDSAYSLTTDSALLDRNSPACFASAARFLLDPRLMSGFFQLAEVIKNGLPDEGTVSPDNPIWVEFANEMAPMIAGSAPDVADVVSGSGPMRVLDIAAGHGLFGITIAQRNPDAQITALDWPNVLAVASANAAKAGVSGRHSLIPGDAFEVDFEGPYDLVLLTNFLHHFDPPTCEKVIGKVLAALEPGGTCATLEFVPNDDRVSPPIPAGFALMMLGSTRTGDAYTFAEYKSMFGNAGFASSTRHDLPHSPETLILSRKA